MISSFLSYDELIGNKIGEWEWSYTDNTPFEGGVEYYVTIKVGASMFEQTSCSHCPEWEKDESELTALLSF